MAGPLDVAIHLTATNGVSSVLAVIGKDVLGLHGNVNKLQKGLANLKPALVGAMSVLVGTGMLAGVSHLVEKGNELVKIQRDMAAAGVTNTQVQNAYAQAWKVTAQYQNLSAVEVMKLINDSRMTFGNQDKATSEIPLIAESMSFLKSYEGGKHAEGAASLLSEMNAALKSGELAGKITPEEMTKHIRELTAMKVAYGESVKISSYLAAQRAGGVALRNTSDDFRYGIFPALVQEQGSSAGVMLMTAFNKIVAGTGNRTKSLEHMAEIGLLNRKELEYDKVGRIKGLKNPDAIKGSQDAAINFGNWVMTTLKPLLDKQTAGLDPQRANIKESQLISAIFPDRNAAKAVTEVIQQFSKLTKDSQQMVAAYKAFDAKGYNAGSLDYQMQAFTTQWNNLQQALGAPAVATATIALSKINAVVNQMSTWTATNPETAKNIVGALTAIGAGLTALGVALVGGALIGAIGSGGWLIAAFAGLGAALAVVKPNALSEMTEGVKKFYSSLASLDFAGAVAGIARTFNAELLGLPGMVASGIASAVSGIGSAISGALSGALSGLGAGLTGNGGLGRGHTPAGVPKFPTSPPAAPIPPRGKQASLILNHTTNIDGRKVAQNVTRHQVAMLEHPNSIGAADSYGYHMGPGTDLPAWG